ncbi:peptidase domain-containing ABC transporter [Romeria aff. gracilis LEGE 07310]|uniref:Peptidase domain-containing ABC transporter n=1 Tax=Vasconcelosia minhoensis LEGE 07310 TaxID=915328 RepID=A0A8J7DMX0_9CYAN|nr:peptidase domain-containing ABC transporter [Romeria gracilis]MBE9077390.1 peptidase domain-containing ABC transporter [Romeria aff. gracilis LEGE 07310]
MTYTDFSEIADLSIAQGLGAIAPFDRLPVEALEQLAANSQRLRYRIGQPILRRETLPYQLIVLIEGQARLLGYDPYTQNPVTLTLLAPGAILGLAGMVRGVACESAIASSEVTAITVPVSTVNQLIAAYPEFAEAIFASAHLPELYELMGQYFKNQARSVENLLERARQATAEAQVCQLERGTVPATRLVRGWVWGVSGGDVAGYPVGSWLDPAALPESFNCQTAVRMVGIRLRTLQDAEAELDRRRTQPASSGGSLTGVEVSDPAGSDAPASEDIPYAPEVTAETPPYAETALRSDTTVSYPHVRGRGEVDAALACFNMLAKHFNMPFKRDVVRKVLTNQKARLGQLSLGACGAVADLQGLKPQLAMIPASSIGRLPKLALIKWRDSFAVIYKATPREYILGVPSERGIIRHSPQAFEEIWGAEGEILLLEATEQTPQQRFGLSWFLPSLKKYRWVLTEVLIASLFVQVFGLANPLMVQVIIDRVIVQNSADTLHVLGIFLVIVAIFEAILTSLRTYLFVDTTNRIDMALGSEIIDHLLRLPLRYFDRRPVGELSSRVNELENIRQFLTGTALTVVLDAMFSVVYIVVMLVYSVKLTVVALATIPLFVVLTLGVSPIVRRQLRAKAERNAETQSFLVEALSGIQTVKAQNIELKTRWKWQERYARYVSDGFKTVLTSTTAGSASSFLNKLSGLLVLWVGAYLVLDGKMTLGALIAFRIIAGYVTAPLLRLTQLWQNFQETGLSLERLSDILDHPQEQEAENRSQIPMPDIKGTVRYENISFRFAPSGPMQLVNINLEFPAGQFTGVVGQSGSGKSTLMKLLPRLYNPESGRILIDQYDISKVELYSLRRQVGIVPQDSLLFEGTIQDNIALTHPDADTESILEAAKIACAHEFIMDLPVGYNTRVGERGSSLSGGQRQRIAIARTILQNPRLLILDEATSALDYDTEAQVCQNLMHWAQGRTVFFITHRLSTIRKAERILVMDRGGVVESGTHQELLDLKGRYYCLYQQQGE